MNAGSAPYCLDVDLLENHSVAGDYFLSDFFKQALLQWQTNAKRLTALPQTAETALDLPLISDLIGNVGDDAHFLKGLATTGFLSVRHLWDAQRQRYLSEGVIETRMRRKGMLMVGLRPFLRKLIAELRRCLPHVTTTGPPEQAWHRYGEHPYLFYRHSGSLDVALLQGKSVMRTSLNDVPPAVRQLVDARAPGWTHVCVRQINGLRKYCGPYTRHSGVIFYMGLPPVARHGLHVEAIVLADCRVREAYRHLHLQATEESELPTWFLANVPEPEPLSWPTLLKWIWWRRVPPYVVEGHWRTIRKAVAIGAWVQARRINDSGLCASCDTYEDIQHYVFNCSEVLPVWVYTHHRLRSLYPTYNRQGWRLETVLYGLASHRLGLPLPVTRLVVAALLHCRFRFHNTRLQVALFASYVRELARLQLGPRHTADAAPPAVGLLLSF